jgi:K+-transporting ATPase ATPase C chain
MFAHLRANLWLLILTLLLCALLYPLILLGIGQAFFKHKADGSLITGKDGKPIGSRLIAQPFSSDEYFWPRPSAVSYNAAASGASNWASSNYLLRDRVARAIGPIVKYRSGPKKGQPAGPDVEAWFRDQDKEKGASAPGIVARWANEHPSVAQNWVKSEKLNSAYVANWQKNHPAEVALWLKKNPSTPEPKPEDLAIPFFTSYSQEHPRTFPVAVEAKSPDGKTIKKLEPAREGAEIQGIFFDMWLQAHPDVDLEPVPSDMVIASGSGLDPHITLKSALYQLDRVAAKWAAQTRRDGAQVRKEIEELLRRRARAPLGGLAGVDLVNVLEINLELDAKYRKRRG